jgi:acetyl-CoA carboxylase carboxyl transferase subunit alpha
MKDLENKNLTPWQRVLLARHPERPGIRDYVEKIFDDFIELHGDRLYGDDTALIGGVAWFEGRPVVIVGNQKGKDTKAKIATNFGMPHPEGYRKAKRLMRLAEKFNRPIITFIDTPGAYPGIGAEERGQGEAIAHNLYLLSTLNTPIIVIITGEGGSGGALAIGVGDRILMFENAIYSVISPEGCAAILWKDEEKAKEAAKALNLTSFDLLRLRIIDEIIQEPDGGAHKDPDKAAEFLKNSIRKNLDLLLKMDKKRLLSKRYNRFRKIGSFDDGQSY